MVTSLHLLCLNVMHEFVVEELPFSLFYKCFGRCISVCCFVVLLGLGVGGFSTEITFPRHNFR